MEVFKMERVKRSKIKNAPYNPREMTDEARLKLRRGLQAYGMVQPITVNKRTMNIVGGHQRLAGMDDLQEGKDYSIHVAMINVDDVQEKEINLLLNNDLMQGEWDAPKMEAMLQKGPKIDWDQAGFSTERMEMILGRFIKKAEGVGGDKRMETAASAEKVLAKNESEQFCLVLMFETPELKTMALDQLGFDTRMQWIDGPELVGMLK